MRFGRVRVALSVIGWSNTVSNYKTLPDTGFVRLASIIAPSGPIPVSTKRG
jgi:hypothetical protein